MDIGCYTSATGGRGAGVSTVRVDAGATAVLSIAETLSPSWLCPHPSLPVVYATNEVGDGAVTTLRRERSGALSVVDSAPTGGSFPCYLALVDDHLIASNYGSGSITVFRLAADGRIVERTDVVEHHALERHAVDRLGVGINPERQEGPHVHMVVPRADGSVRAVDLGLDQVITYALSSDGRLSLRDVLRLPAGFGPRQLIELPDGRALVLGELASSIAVVDGGVVLEVVASTNHSAPQGNLPAQLTMLDGLQVGYVSNRGADCITRLTYRDGAVRTTADLAVGRGPRHFAVTDEFLVVAAQDDDRVEVRRRGDGAPVMCVDTGSPTFVLISPDGTPSPQGGSVH